MVEDKIGLILDYGVPTILRDRRGVIVSETNTLIGKATKSTLTEISLEYHRMCQFVPTTPLTNGMHIENKVTGETYLSVAQMKEVVDGEVCALISRAVICNNVMSVYKFAESADANGDWKRGRVDKHINVPIHISKSVYSLEMTQIGALVQSEFQILAPSVDIDTLDSIDLIVLGKPVKYKIVTVDYVTYPDLCVISVNMDTRR